MFTQVPLLPFFEIRETFIDADTLGNQILADDWRRIAIIIQNIGSNPVTIRPKIACQIGEGLNLASGAIPLRFLFKDFGTLTTSAWFARADIMNSGLVIYETLYAPLFQTKPEI